MSIAHHVYTAVDCANPVSLARFYAEITGWDVGEIEDAGDEWVDLFHNGVRMMAFQKVANYIPPTWPEGPVPQQIFMQSFIVLRTLNPMHLHLFISMAVVGYLVGRFAMPRR